MLIRLLDMENEAQSGSWETPWYSSPTTVCCRARFTSDAHSLPSSLGKSVSGVPFRPARMSWKKRSGMVRVL